MNSENNKPLLEHLKRQIDSIAYDMRDQRFDGYFQEHCRVCLKELRDHINKVLEQ